MNEKYANMTPEQVAVTLSDRMIGVLSTGHASTHSARVIGSTNTIVALIDRGLVQAGRDRRWTRRGFEVARLVLSGKTYTIDELHEKALAENAVYDDLAGVTAAQLSPDPADAAALSPRLGLSPERKFAPVEPHPLKNCGPLELRLVPGEQCPTCGGRAVELPPVAYDGQGGAIVPAAGRSPRAVRACCSTAIGAEHEGTCASIGARCERAVEAMARPVPRTTDQLDAYGVVWRVGDRVQPAGPICEPGDVWRIRAIYVPDDREPYAGIELVQRVGGLGYGTTGSGVPLRHLRRVTRPATAVDALRKLRDDHLPAWLRTCIENDEARDVRDREADPERVVLHAADVRTMIADVARECGVEL